MVRLLSLALSVSVISATLAYQDLDEVLHNIKINSRQQSPPKAVNRILSKDVNTCIGSGWELEGLNRFTAIIFGDFYTGGSQDILGALAVEGDFHAPNYVVNTNGGPECDDEDSLYYYGLIVGGITDTINTQVHGSAYLGGGGTIENVVTLEEGCIVTEDEAYDVFDFDDTKAFLIQTSSDFAGLDATLLLGSDHSLTNLRECGEDSYEVITFSSCGELGYSATTEFESYASSIFFGEGNWNGVQGSITIDRSKTYILNIPVLNGETITLDTNSPSLGFNPCTTIYNIYPVDENGVFLPEGEITVIRKTSSQLGGFILAPRANIVDGSCGNFAGTLIGLSYTWENLYAGVEIHDYYAAGGVCDYYLGCTPEEAAIPSTSSSVTPSTTSKIQTTTTTTTDTRTTTSSRTMTTTNVRVSTLTEFRTRVTTATTSEQITTTSTYLHRVPYTETICDVACLVSTVTQSITGPITTVTQTVSPVPNNAALAPPPTTVIQRVAGPTVTVTRLAAAPVSTVTRLVAAPVSTVTETVGELPNNAALAAPISIVTETIGEPLNNAALAAPASTITLTTTKIVSTTATIEKTITDCPTISPAAIDIDYNKPQPASGEEYSSSIFNDFTKDHSDNHLAPGEVSTGETYNKVEEDHKSDLGDSRLAPGEVPTGEVSTGEVSTGEVPTGEVFTGEVSTGEVFTGEVPTGEVSTGEVSTGETYNKEEGDHKSDLGDSRLAPGEVPTGEMSTGEVPTGEVPTGEVPTGEVPTGETYNKEEGDHKSDLGDSRLAPGEVSTEEAPIGEVSIGEVPIGEVPTGEVLIGEVSTGDTYNKEEDDYKKGLGDSHIAPGEVSTEDTYNKEEDYKKGHHGHHHGHHHGPGEVSTGDISNKEEKEDYKKIHHDHHHGSGEVNNEDSHIKEDNIKDHSGHHHSPGEVCNEASFVKDEDYTKKHSGHHHGPGEECKESSHSEEDDYNKHHHGHNHSYGEKCNEGDSNKDDDSEDDD